MSPQCVCGKILFQSIFIDFSGINHATSIINLQHFVIILNELIDWRCSFSYQYIQLAFIFTELLSKFKHAFGVWQIESVNMNILAKDD